MGKDPVWLMNKIQYTSGITDVIYGLKDSLKSEKSNIC